MADLSVLLDRVHDEYPAVPKALALRALSDSTREFCTRTHAWRDDLPVVQLVVGQTAYELSPDSGTKVVAVKRVAYNGHRVDPVPTELWDLRRRDGRAGEPAGYIQWDPGAIELVNAPAEAGELTINAALTLTLDEAQVQVPDSLVEEYGEALASGAKMRLVRQAGQSWYAPDAVIAYAGPFYTAVTQAKARVRSALGEAQTQVQMRRW